MRRIEGKVVMLGSKGVGKTTLIMNYMKNIRVPENQLTAAVSFLTCKVNLEDCKVILHIWDTVGQERFRAVTPLFYRNTNAAILVFDLADYVTFAEIKSWMQELHRYVQDPIVITLVGNKLDLHSKRVVSRDEAFLFATSNGANYMECSADTGQGLEQVFLSTALGLHRLANEGKSRSLRQYNSTESIYTQTNTAYSYMKAALSNRQLQDYHNTVIHLPIVPFGTTVDNHIKANGEGRLETPSWSIEHIAWGEEVRVGWCY